jgi:signal transduction histidine kinase
MQRPSFFKASTAMAAPLSDFDAAVATLHQPFVIFDAGERLIVWNNAYAALHRDRSGACVLRPGMTIDELSAWRLQNGFFHAAGAHSLRTEPTVHNPDQGKGALIHRLGDGRWMLVDRYPLPDGRNVGLWIDITELKNTEQRLRETAESLARGEAELSRMQAALKSANEDLERRVRARTDELVAAQDELVKKERLSAVGQLTATVAHELRNPMSAIKNTVFTLKDYSANKAPELERPLARIDRSIERCDKIIGELLDYSRARDLQKEILGFDPWLREVVTEIKSPPQIGLALELGAGNAKIALDSDRLRRVVINLVENSIQAFSEVEEPRVPARITVRTRIIDQRVECEIEDNGPGISPENLAKIFEPLFTTKRYGTGLGLPTVKQIVAQHGGDITLTSTVGEHTRAVIWLPLAAS